MKKKQAAWLLALFLWGLGVHKFYLGQIGTWIFYVIFCWTWIPALIGLIEWIQYLTMSDEKFAEHYKWDYSKQCPACYSDVHKLATKCSKCGSNIN